MTLLLRCTRSVACEFLAFITSSNQSGNQVDNDRDVLNINGDSDGLFDIDINLDDERPDWLKLKKLNRRCLARY